MKPTFEKTTGVLIKAYLKGHLQHVNCYACAVGNMVADAMNYRIIEEDIYDNKLCVWEDYSDSFKNWAWVFSTSPRFKTQYLELDQYTGLAKEQIDSTGYSVWDLAKIEYAFESAEKGDDWEYNGLIAVFNVLADIHQVDLTTRTTALESLTTLKG